MKKCMKVAFLTILLILNIGVSICLAKDPGVNPWTIESYDAIVEVGPDGSMEIEEYIEYSFTKEFSGNLLRDIDTSAASGVDDLELFSPQDTNGDDMAKPELTPLEPGTYQVLMDEEYGIVEGVSISLEPGTRRQTLVFKYKLNDLIGIYSDMALLDWTFLNSEENFPGKEISLSIKLPGKVDGETHENILEGPLYTELDIDENLLKYSGRRMDKGRALRLLILLPKSSIPEGRKMIDNEIAAKIQGEISQYWDEIETVRNEYETHLRVRRSMSYLGFGIIILTFIYLYFKYGRGPKVQVGQQAYGELPADFYTPAELGILMNKGKVKPDYMVATLIDLYNRGYLYIEDGGDEGFLLSRNKASNVKELKSHEEYLLDWLFGDISHGASEVTTEAIHSWNKDHRNKKRYKHKYSTWKDLVINQAQCWKFFEDVGGARLMGLLSGIVGLVPGIVLLVFDEITLGATIIGLSFGLVLYSRFIFKPTEFGAINRANWEAFIKQMKGSATSEAQAAKTVDYEKLLGYSIPLNIWKDLLAKRKSLHRDEEPANSGEFLTHENNLEKTRRWILTMGGSYGISDPSKERDGYDFKDGTDISQ